MSWDAINHFDDYHLCLLSEIIAAQLNKRKKMRLSKSSRELLPYIKDPIPDQSRKMSLVAYMSDVANRQEVLWQMINNIIEIASRPAVNGLLTIGPYNDVQIAEFDDLSKEYIINIIKKHAATMRTEDINLRSLKLLDRLNNPFQNPEEIWSDILNFCRNQANHDSLLYRFIKHQFRSHSIDDDYALKAVRLYSRTHATTQDYSDAISYLQRIRHKDAEIYMLMGQCYYAKAEYQHSYVCYRNATLQQSGYESSINEPLKKLLEHKQLHHVFAGRYVRPKHFFFSGKKAINREQQEQMVRDLEIAHDFPANIKLELLTSIAVEYNNNRSLLASRVSKQLVKLISDDSSPLNTRWEALQNYMLRTQRAGWDFSHNGRRLFRIAAAKLREQCRLDVHSQVDIAQQFVRSR